MKESPLTPPKLVESSGKVSYTESNQAWGTIRLKSEIIHEFRQLKEKRSRFKYKLLFFRDHKDFEEKIKSVVRDKGAIPFLIWLEKERDY